MTIYDASGRQVDRLFEVFGQIDRRKMEQQGTGLGLVIAQALMTCMGGDIHLVSSQQAPSGTTVNRTRCSAI